MSSDFFGEGGEEHNDITQKGINEIDNLTLKFYIEAVNCCFFSLHFNIEH